MGHLIDSAGGGAMVFDIPGGGIGQNRIQELSWTALPLTAAAPRDYPIDPVSKREVVADEPLRGYSWKPREHASDSFKPAVGK